MNRTAPVVGRSGPLSTSAGETAMAGRDRFYIPEIDGLRAIAVGSVMLCHLDPRLLPGGFCGVDVFFVISGYVVTASLLRDIERPFGSFLKRFYARRVLRIVPGLLVCLTLGTIASVLLVPRSWLSETMAQTALFAFFGVGNVALLRSDWYFAPRPEFNPFTHTWSLGVEEQFYLVFPLLLFAGWALSVRHRPRVALACVAAASVVSFGFMGALTPAHADLAFFSMPSRFWELGVGAALLLCQQGRPDLRLAGKHVSWVFGAGLAVLAIAMVFADPSAFPFPWALPAVAGTALLIAAASHEAPQDTHIARLLRSRGMIFIGRISYALYLWHWVVYAMMRWTVGLQGLPLMAFAVGLSLVLACGSTALIEMPLRRSRWGLSQPPEIVILAALLSLAAAWSICWVAFDNQNRLGLSVVARNPAAWYGDEAAPDRTSAGCALVQDEVNLAGMVHRVRLRPQCPSAAPTLRQVFVLGDSHAAAYAPMLRHAATALNLGLVDYIQAGCGVADLLRPADRQCKLFQDAAIDDILKLASRGDLVFLASLRMVRLGEQYGAFTAEKIAHDTQGPDAVADREAALGEASTIVGRLQRAGLQVIIAYPLPVFRSPAFRCSDWFNRGNPDCAGGLSIDRADLATNRGPIVELLGRLTAAHPGLIAWDAFDWLCPGPVCRATTADGPLFIDGDHITAYANRLLTPHFMELLALLTH